MKRAKQEYTTAINDLEALHKYQAGHESIKVIFMGMKPLSSVNAPILESCRWMLEINVPTQQEHWKSFNVPIKHGTMIANLHNVDIAMPVKDGIAATKEIRQFERDTSIPRVRIAALTCFSTEEYKKNAFAAGVDLFLVKPMPMKAFKPILEMDPDVVVPP
jgi:CheY-like chemotaxis protein